MTMSPSPHYPERITPVWERKFTDQRGVPGRKGPLRFEEGIGTDTDVPNGFTEGIMQGYRTAPGRPNHNAKVDTKTPAETLAARAHVGSASWIEGPSFIGEFRHGSNGDHGAVQFETVQRHGRYLRQNPANITD